MSKIIVDQIQKTSGTALTWPAADGAANQVIETDGSGTLSFTTPSSGKVGQIVETVKTTTTSSTSASYVDMTGMTVSITPTATSSKILVMTSLTVCGSATYSMMWQFVRGSTPICIGTDATSNRQNCTQHSQSQTGRTTHNMGMSYLDSPSTTSATTYKLQWLVEGSTTYLNRTNSDNDAAYIPRCASTITVMEILA